MHSTDQETNHLQCSDAEARPIARPTASEHRYSRTLGQQTRAGEGDDDKRRRMNNASKQRSQQPHATLADRPQQATRYRLRVQRVLAHIDTHLQDPLAANERSGIAVFTDEGVAECVRRLRLEYSAYALRATSERIRDIALAAGYESPEAFARAFKRSMKFSPSAFTHRGQLTQINTQHRVQLERNQTRRPPNNTRSEQYLNFHRASCAQLPLIAACHASFLQLRGLSVVQWPPPPHTRTDGSRPAAYRASQQI